MLMDYSYPLYVIRIRRFFKVLFDVDKVTKAILGCCGNKALVPNGIAMAFLQSNWNTVKNDVMNMFAEFFSLGKFVVSIDATFIGLTRKKHMLRI